jgi:peptide chain release factor 3
MRVETFPHPSLADTLGEAYGPLQEEIALLTGAGTKFDRDRFLAGQLTPVFFGSALTNFGVEPFLNAFLQLAPPPSPRMSSQGLMQPMDEKFSGFVFKIQANMDPQHRDRMAFLRIVSGRFEKDMMVHHARLDRKIRMTRPHRLFGRDRETIEEAYPGDVVGLVNPGLFAIGDTLCRRDSSSSKKKESCKCSIHLIMCAGSRSWPPWENSNSMSSPRASRPSMGSRPSSNGCPLSWLAG